MTEDVRVGRRKTTYGVTAILLFLGYLLLRNITWEGGIQLHTLMELTATLLAINVGVLALVRYYSKPHNTFLFIGTGFLGTGLLDGYHTVVTSSFFIESFPSPHPSLIPWSWLASRIFLSILLWLSWVFWKKESKLGETGRVNEYWVYFCVFLFTLFCFVFFAFVPLPEAYQHHLVFPRPQEFVPAIFFLLALIGYLRKGDWKNDAFEHWLVLSLIVAFMSQAMFMSFSGKLYDSMFDAAHLLKKLSYILSLVGLLVNMHFLFQLAEKDIITMKQVYDTLRQSEEKLGAITNTARDAIVMMDDEGKISFWNPAAENMFGYSISEALTQDMHAFLGPKRYYEAFQKGFATFRQTGQGPAVGQTVQLAAIRKGGLEFPIELSLSAIQIRDRWHAVGVIRDITARKQGEVALKQSEQELREAQRVAKVGSWELDTKSGAVSWSEEINRIFGRDLQLPAPSFNNLGQWMTVESMSRMTSAIEKTVKTGEPYEIDIELVRPDNTRGWISSRGEVKTRDGETVILRGTALDITERKLAEKELQQRSLMVGRLNNTLVELARNNMIYSGSLDVAFREITEASARAMEVGRVSIWFYSQDIPGVRCMDLYDTASKSHTAGYILEASAYPSYFAALSEERSIVADYAMSDPRTREFSESYLKPLGITSMLDVSVRVAGSVMGVVCHEHVGPSRVWSVEEQSFATAIAGFITMSIEIHERLMAEENIRRLNEELEQKVQDRTKQLVETQEELVRKEKLSILGQLAGSVGHELRNPLGVISNAVYFLNTVMPDAEEMVREYLAIIKNEVNNSERIISDLLDFSRTKTPQEKAISVCALINHNLSRCAVPDNVTVKLDIPDTLPDLMTDPLQMGQVFQNLIINAIQAMPEGGKLTIAARVADSSWLMARGKTGTSNDQPKNHDPDRIFIVISVLDTGEGISPENMKKLFQPLFTTKSKGIGLGLVASKRLTEANGGIMEAESELGRGTKFTVILPSKGGQDNG